MAQNVARLGVVLGIDTAEFTKGIESVKRSVGDLILKIPTMAAVGVAAFTAMAVKAMQFSDQISDTADSVEVSIGFVLKLRQALELSGGSADNAGKMLEKFAANVASANNGTQGMLDAFKRIGITTKDLASMSMEKLFVKATDGIDELGDSISKTGAKLEIFGKGSRGVAMGGLNAIIKEGTSDMDAYADAVRQAGDLHDKLNERATQTGLIFTLKVMPVLNGLFDEFLKKGGIATVVSQGVRDLLIGMWDVAGNLSIIFREIGTSMAFWQGKMTASDFDRAMMNLDNEKKLLKVKLDGYQLEIKEQDKIVVKEDIRRKQTESGENKKLRLMVEMAALTAKEFNREQQHSYNMLVIKNNLASATTNEKAIQEAVNNVLDATSKKIADIQKQRDSAVAHGGQEDVIAQLNIEEEKVAKLGTAWANLTRIQETGAIAAQRTFEFGWNKAFNQYAEDAGNYGKLAQDMFTSFTNNMNSALDKFVDTGKLSFSDLAQSIIKDIIKIQLRMQMAQLFSMAKGGFGSLFGSAGGFTNEAGGVELAGSLGFAEGGDPPVGIPSLVGENGPELFIPKSSGTIIPNNKIGDAMGGGGGITYNGPVIQNMQAIDTQSGIQFLAKNKMTIWSMNQSANRSIPTGR